MRPDETNPTAMIVMIEDDWTIMVVITPVPTPARRCVVAFSCDVLGYKRKYLDVGPEVFDFAFNVLLVGREAPGETAADLKCLLLVIDEFDSPEDDDAPERVRPAAIVLHAIVDDGERCH